MDICNRDSDLLGDHNAVRTACVFTKGDEMTHGQDYIGNIRTFETANFKVSIDAEYDYDTDLSFDDTGEVQRKLENGEFLAFQVAVTVTHKPTSTELGADYLGGCIYESIEAFMDHRECGKANREYERKGERGRCGSYFADMIHEAIKEARKEVAKLKGIQLRAA